MGVVEGLRRTIWLFLVNGRPTALCKQTIHGWPALLFVSGASVFGGLTAREEVDRTGVYALVELDPDQPTTHPQLSFKFTNYRAVE